MLEILIDELVKSARDLQYLMDQPDSLSQEARTSASQHLENAKQGMRDYFKLATTMNN